MMVVRSLSRDGPAAAGLWSGHASMSGRKDPTPPSADDGATAVDSCIAECPPDPCGKDAIANVTECCGSEIFAAAKKANGGKDPKIVFGKPSSGFDAETDTTTGTITVNSGLSQCTATEKVYFELANLSNKPAFDKVDGEVAAGNLSREDYAIASEQIEYDSLTKTLAAIDKCKKQWGCASHPFDFDGFRPAKGFGDYYKNYLRESHKDYYRNFWDSGYKAAYDAKHPTPPGK